MGHEILFVEALEGDNFWLTYAQSQLHSYQ